VDLDRERMASRGREIGVLHHGIGQDLTDEGKPAPTPPSGWAPGVGRSARERPGSAAVETRELAAEVRQARLGLRVLGSDAGQLLEKAHDVSLQLGDGPLAHHQLVLGMADRLAEPEGSLLELLHDQPRGPRPVAALVEGHLLLAAGCHHRVAIALEGVEPGTDMPEAFDVAGRPDRHGGLLHRIAEMPVPIDQPHQRGPLGGLILLGRDEVLSGPTQGGLRDPLHFPRHRRRPGSGAGARRKPPEGAARRPRPDGGGSHGGAGPVDGGCKDPDETPQPDRRQVAASDHRSNGLLVAPEPAGGVGDGEEKRGS
jgi:hypothetical protein